MINRKKMKRKENDEQEMKNSKKEKNIKERKSM